MTVGSDNPFPSILVQEHVDPSNPAAGYQRLFVDTDHILKMVDSAGTVTSFTAGATLATDTLWDTAGDLVVGTGANTAAKLVKGSAGGALSMINAAVAWNSGTSFPGSVVTGDRYWRTDLGEEYYYDGTRWVSVTLSRLSLGTFQNLSANASLDAAVEAADGDVWLVAMYVSFYVVTTVDAGKYWNTELFKYDAGSGTSLGTVNCQSGTANTFIRKKLTIGALLGTAMDDLNVSITKTSTPGNLYGGALITYRTVRT